MRATDASKRWAIRIGIAAIALVAGTIAVRYLVLSPSPDSPDQRWRRLAGDTPPESLSVVLITIDTLRADRLGAHGYEEIETPAIDRLADEGVLFENAVTTVPFTLPAHSSIMTGTYPPHHGVRENVGYVLDDRDPTLAEVLRAHGYATGGFVSAFVLDGRWGIGRGFDRYYDEFDPADATGANLASVQRPGNETVEEAIGWLDGVDRPFFLWLHLFEPHDPYTPPGPYADKYPGRPYDGEVAYADYLVGELRKALERRHLLDGTLVVLTSDHGEGLDDHGEAFHGYFVYDSTVHVPLIIRPPFGEPARLRVEEAVSHVDLLPTILAATGREPAAAVRRALEARDEVSAGTAHAGEGDGVPGGAASTADGPPVLHGKSLLPLILGSREPTDRSVYAESYYPLYHYGWAPLRALRSSSRKFIDAPDAELYDLAADPGELRNLLHRGPRTGLRREWEQHLASMTEELGFEEGSGAAPRVDLDEETLEQLRALGYVAGRGAAGDEDVEGPRADPKEKLEIHQLVMAAQSDVGSGAYEAAAEKLHRVLEADPGLLDAHQILGNIASRRGDHRTAARHFRNALELDPEHLSSLFGLAEAYRRLGRIDAALTGYRRLLAVQPGEVKALLAISRILADRGELAEGLRLLEEETRGDDAPALLLNQAGELLTLMGRRQEAVERFRRAAARNDDLAQPHFNLAVIHEESGRLDEAIDEYRAAIERGPEHYRAQFNLGRLYGRLGQPDRQRQMYEAAIESNPEFVRGYFFLAKLLMDRGESLARAEELTRRGLELDPERETGPLGYFLLADILNRAGRADEARRALITARRIETSSSRR